MGHMFSFLLGKCLGVKLLGPDVARCTLCITMWQGAISNQCPFSPSDSSFVLCPLPSAALDQEAPIAQGGKGEGKHNKAYSVSEAEGLLSCEASALKDADSEPTPQTTGWRDMSVRMRL